jgi:hypothetical protein
MNQSLMTLVFVLKTNLIVVNGRKKITVSHQSCPNRTLCTYFKSARKMFK